MRKLKKSSASKLSVETRIVLPATSDTYRRTRQPGGFVHAPPLIVSLRFEPGHRR